MMINQYLLTLGEYDQIANYNQSHLGAMCWLFFILASFMSTVVVLNMVIAIMNDTYSRVSENYVLQSKRMKIWIMIDYLQIIRMC